MSFNKIFFPTKQKTDRNNVYLKINLFSEMLNVKVWFWQQNQNIFILLVQTRKI